MYIVNNELMQKLRNVTLRLAYFCAILYIYIYIYEIEKLTLNTTFA